VFDVYHAFYFLFSAIASCYLFFSLTCLFVFGGFFFVFFYISQKKIIICTTNLTRSEQQLRSDKKIWNIFHRTQKYYINCINKTTEQIA